MWICICNAINEEGISNAIKTGKKDPSEILKYCHGKVACGACLADIQKILNKDGY